MTNNERALVLGGGGVAGIAWETGILTALAEAGVAVAGADLVVGTSAGSTVAAQLGSGLPLAELFRRQVEPAAQYPELVPDVDVGHLWTTIMDLRREVPAEEMPKRLGELALAADTVPEQRRRDAVAGRLPSHDWPAFELVVTAVDAYSGAFRTFDRGSGVALVDAVAASCAVPMVWPPVTIGGTRYVDGGVRTGANADLAAGYERVLVVAPMAEPELDESVAALRRDSRVEVIVPDDATVAAFGTNPLDPDSRTPAGRAGYEQGRRDSARVARLWS